MNKERRPARRKRYERDAVAAVRKYVRLLGLDGPWQFSFAFHRVDDDKQLDGAPAYVAIDRMRQIARVRFDERVNPACYECQAAHEVLHVFFDLLQCAVNELTEPSKTLMDTTIHQMVECLARVVSGDMSRDEEEYLDAPPWEGGKIETTPAKGVMDGI